MSSAHYFVKNYRLKEVLDLMCYTTRFPHTLTSTQKITRLYRYVKWDVDACWDVKELLHFSKIVVIQKISMILWEAQEKDLIASWKFQRIQLNSNKLLKNLKIGFIKVWNLLSCWIHAGHTVQLRENIISLMIMSWRLILMDIMLVPQLEEGKKDCPICFTRISH